MRTFGSAIPRCHKAAIIRCLAVHVISLLLLVGISHCHIAVLKYCLRRSEENVLRVVHNLFAFLRRRSDDTVLERLCAVVLSSRIQHSTPHIIQSGAENVYHHAEQNLRKLLLSNGFILVEYRRHIYDPEIRD